MKNYLRMIPVVLYPYLYIPALIIYSMVYDYLPDDPDKIFYGFIAFIVIYNLYCIVIGILNTVETVKGEVTLSQAARINLIVKCLHIPSYCFHVVLFIVGALLSVWGIPFMLWACLISCITICLTGIASVGCSIRMYKEERLNMLACIFMGIGCFVFCADLVIAVIYLVKAISTKKVQKRMGGCGDGQAGDNQNLQGFVG